MQQRLGKNQEYSELKAVYGRILFNVAKKFAKTIKARNLYISALSTVESQKFHKSIYVFLASL